MDTELMEPTGGMSKLSSLFASEALGTLQPATKAAAKKVKRIALDQAHSCIYKSS